MSSFVGLLKFKCMWNLGGRKPHKFSLFSVFQPTYWTSERNLSVCSVQFVAGRRMAEKPQIFPFRVARTKSNSALFLFVCLFVYFTGMVELDQQVANGAGNTSLLPGHQKPFDVSYRVCGPQPCHMILCILSGQIHLKQNPCNSNISR